MTRSKALMRARCGRLGLAAAVCLIPIGALWVSLRGLAGTRPPLADTLSGAFGGVGPAVLFLLVPTLVALLGAVSMRDAKCDPRPLSTAGKAAVVGVIALLVRACLAARPAILW